jgi:hypothetical protein
MASTRQFGYKRGNLSRLNSVGWLPKTIFALRRANLPHNLGEYLYHALSAGAEGYLLKQDADSELLTAIKSLRNGKTYVSPLLSPELTGLFVEKFSGPGFGRRGP